MLKAEKAFLLEHLGFVPVLEVVDIRQEYRFFHEAGQVLPIPPVLGGGKEFLSQRPRIHVVQDLSNDLAYDRVVGALGSEGNAGVRTAESDQSVNLEGMASLHKTAGNKAALAAADHVQNGRFGEFFVLLQVGANGVNLIVHRHNARVPDPISDLDALDVGSVLELLSDQFNAPLLHGAVRVDTVHIYDGRFGVSALVSARQGEEANREHSVNLKHLYYYKLI